MLSFSVGYPDADRLVITLLPPVAGRRTEGYDWIGARVEAVVGGFRGDVKIQLCVSDIVRFRDQLEPVYRLLTGSAELTTLEGQLYIRIGIDKLGHVSATGYLKGDFYSLNKLEFEICYDQTLLWHTIAEIDQALFELSQGNPE